MCRYMLTVYICICIRISIHIYNYVCTYAFAYSHRHTHTHMHICTHIHIHTYATGQTRSPLAQGTAPPAVSPPRGARCPLVLAMALRRLPLLAWLASVLTPASGTLRQTGNAAYSIARSGSALQGSVLAERACTVERAGHARAPQPSRQEACAKCIEFQHGHRDSEYVKPNKPLCPKCYSVVSSCNRAQFAWSCYDENESFDVLAKAGGGALDDPSEMHESFKDKAPRSC